VQRKVFSASASFIERAAAFLKHELREQEVTYAELAKRGR
jgi:DNA-binding transcriptional regulator YdaS (Cro superfamily)